MTLVYLLAKITLAVMDLNISTNLQNFQMPDGLTDTMVECESKGLSNKKINPPVTANHRLSPKLIW